MKNGNGELDPIEQMRKQQEDQQLRGTQLAGALHQLLAHHGHMDVINACMLMVAARAKMGNVKRADIRTLAGQMFDSVTVQAQEPSAVLVPPSA